MLNNPLDFEKPISELDDLINEFKNATKEPQMRADAETKGIDIEQQIAELETKRDALMQQIFSNLTPWNEVQMARHKDRPYTLDYIRAIFEDFMELHGDRTNADDPAIVGGFARFNGEPVVVLGHQKARDLKERQLRNFGSARPSGFRKALRLMKLAEKFSRPLIIFIDTPAAEANLRAEEEGISSTIAICLREMSVLRTPIIVIVIGEGGSGGALGIAVGDAVLMLEHAIYSVIPPEGCAAILWSDRSRAPEAAAALKLTAKHAAEFGLIDEVIYEPVGGAHRDHPQIAESVKSAVTRHLDGIKRLSEEELIDRRYQKFREMGRWEDTDFTSAVVHVTNSE